MPLVFTLPYYEVAFHSGRVHRRDIDRDQRGESSDPRGSMSLDDHPDPRAHHSADPDALADAPPITDPAPIVQATDPAPTRRSRLRLPLLLAAPIVAIVVGLF